jgi:hypothetical protein
MSDRFFLRLFAALLFGVIGVNASAAEVPYAMLYQSLEPSIAIAKYPKLHATQRIVSRMPEIKPQQINVQILARAGVINVPIDDLGRAQFPLTKALLAENPMVRSNQPKGSLSVSATMELALAGKLRMSYQELIDAVREAEQAVSELSAMQGRKIQTIEFEFAPSDNAQLQLNDDRSEEILMADQRGLIRVRIDLRKLKSKAEIVISAKSRAVRPQLE